MKLNFIAKYLHEMSHWKNLKRATGSKTRIYSAFILDKEPCPINSHNLSFPSKMERTIFALKCCFIADRWTQRPLCREVNMDLRSSMACTSIVQVKQPILLVEKVSPLRRHRKTLKFSAIFLIQVIILKETNLSQSTSHAAGEYSDLRQETRPWRENTECAPEWTEPAHCGQTVNIHWMNNIFFSF